MTSRTLGHRAPLLWVLLPLMAGLVAGKLEWLPPSPLACSFASAACLGLAFGWRRAWAGGLVAGVFFSGVAYYDLRRTHLPEWDSLPPREARVTLQVDRVFPSPPDMRSITGLATVRAADPHLADLVGQRAYFSLTPPRDGKPVIRSVRFEATGLLQSLPRNPPTDTFEGYLADQGVNFRFTRARVTGEFSEAGAYRIFCDAALRRFTTILGLGVEKHPEEVGVLRAMLLGSQSELSDDQKTVFRNSGTMHLFSISGLHIAVIAGVITGILAFLRLPPTARLLAGGVLLWLYVDITGGAPSAVRAWIMAMFIHAACTLRVPGNPVAALVASAVCVLAIDPLQLFTASFQLSYGIVASLLLLGLPLGDRLAERAALFTRLPAVSWGMRHKALDAGWRKFLSALAIGLATMPVSTVCGVVIFGLFTPVSLIANLVLIPAGSLVIVSGFLALLCGLAGLGWLASILNHASVLMLKAVDAGVRFFADLPGAHHEAVFSPVWLGYAGLAALFTLVFFGYASDWRLRRGGCWPPFVFTALLLAAGAVFGPQT